MEYKIIFAACMKIVLYRADPFEYNSLILGVF